MRSSLLDIQLTPNNRPAPSTTVIRMHIEPRNRLGRSQHHRQLQFCVPLVATTMPVCNGRSSTALESTGSPRRSPQPAIPVWEVMMVEDFRQRREITSNS